MSKLVQRSPLKWRETELQVKVTLLKYAGRFCCYDKVSEKVNLKGDSFILVSFQKFRGMALLMLVKVETSGQKGAVKDSCFMS